MAELNISGVSRSFEEKFEALDVEKKAAYETIKAALLAKAKNAHGRVSKKCDTYNIGRKVIARISIIGKCLRVHLAFDPASEALEKIPFQDLSDKKLYADVPVMIRISSPLALKRCLSIIEKM